MNKIRIAIVGLGTRALPWIWLLEKFEEYRITAICDPVGFTHNRARACLRHPEEVTTYTRYEDVLADEGVDAVALTARCQEQGMMSAMALEAGKHCVQEVPAAHRMEDCWRIVTAQERTGKVYLCAEQGRYSGYVQAWRKLVQEGTLGKITYAEGQYFHYYVDKCFRDPETGALCRLAELDKYPNAEPTWMWHMPPIHYLVHDLSPLLKILDDRVVEVVGMSTDSPSEAHPQLQWPDMQVALMKTAKGTLLRLAVSFAQPHPEPETHWLQVIGTRGAVEGRRAANDKPKMWLADWQMQDKTPMEWSLQRMDEPLEARGTGHGNLDYYVPAEFRDVVLHRKAPDFDVYGAMNVAAAGILAADSIAQDGKKIRLPDFCPNAERPAGQIPSTLL